MRYFSLKKLWDLRADLNRAVVDEDYNAIQGIGERYQNLVKDEKLFSRAFICYNHAFWRDSDRSSHNIANINAIARNIEDYERKYFDGEDVSVKLKMQGKTPFLAGEIWIIREMYDKFLKDASQCQDELSIQQNMILGKAVVDRVRVLMTLDSAESYREDLLAIVKEVREGYESIYGKRAPKIDYSQLSEDYLER